MTPEMWVVVGLTITGVCSFMGVAYSSNKSHNSQDIKQDAIIDKIRAENKAAMDLIQMELRDCIDSLKRDIKRLEVKQDKHNSLIERMTIAEQQIRFSNDKINALQQKI